MSCNCLIHFLKLRGFCCMLGATILVSLASSATAAVITGESATASTTRYDGAGNFQAAHAVDDSGLSGGLHDEGQPSHMWLSHHSSFESVDTDPWFRIDLGGVYDITSFHVWNYDENFGGRANGLQNVDIYYSTSNASVGTADSFLASYVFPNADDTLVNPGGGDFHISGDDFSATLTARYIYLDINSNYGGAAYGLSEIQFTGTAVPEPSSVLLLTIGSVLVGWRFRRR